MRIVVPLAGPDFVRRDGGVKALSLLDGEPLLRKVLTSRSWAPQATNSDYAFVLLDSHKTRAFADTVLAEWYPDATVVFLSSLTRGAALSALAALAAHRNSQDRLIVDLADILYTNEVDPLAAFDTAPKLGAIALTFKSDEPIYSYLMTDDMGRFVRAAEKSVISETASAGTYFFASSSVYLRALAYALENEAEQTHRGLFYVCPLMNGVRDQGLNVALSPVQSVRDIKVLKEDNPCLTSER